MPSELRSRCSDFVDYYIKVPCGRCALCKDRRSKDWKVRLTFECQNGPYHYMFGKYLPRVMFATLTFDDKKLKNIDDYDFSEYFVRFRDSFRKCYGKSPRYFAITDRGSQFGRLHLHMLIFAPAVWNKEEKRQERWISVSELYEKRLWWSYGFVHIQWVKNPNVASYVCGYITGANMYSEEPVKHGKPICEKALRYMPKVYVSKGIGKCWLTQENMDKVWRNEEFFVQLNDFQYALPRYYTNAIWTAEERFHHNLLNMVENYDYFVRNNFCRDKFRYDYKGVPKTYEGIMNLRLFREKFTTPEKEKVLQTFDYTELNFYDVPHEVDLEQLYFYSYNDNFLTNF